MLHLLVESTLFQRTVKIYDYLTIKSTNIKSVLNQLNQD